MKSLNKAQNKISTYVSSDLAHNSIETISTTKTIVLRNENGSETTELEYRSPLTGLSRLHDIILSYNNLTDIRNSDFKGLRNLQVLDLSNNQIEDISSDAFKGLGNLEDL